MRHKLSRDEGSVLDNWPTIAILVALPIVGVLISLFMAKLNHPVALWWWRDILGIL